MNVVKFNPVVRTHNMHNAFDEFFNRGVADFVGTDSIRSMPSVNVSETEDAFQIELAAPGLQKEDFKITVDKHHLSISAEQAEDSEGKEGTFRRREFNFSTFSRRFHLPRTIDKDAITADYDNGVLSVALPKKSEVVKEEQTRTISLG